ncbi:NAD(P)-binding protein [Xylariaceae sp. FL1272]|nr:NAD(P)-binding protein [Xylariaceae sp. FL1272]
MYCYWAAFGKVAQLLTPMLLNRSWRVTSIIRNPEQVTPLETLGAESASRGGRLTVLVRSIDDITSETHAKAVIDEVQPDYVVWCAGAGGKGSPDRFEIMDRDAACYYIRAALGTPTITKFVLISFIGCRIQKASWVTEANWQQYLASTRGPFHRYYEAKLVADRELYEAGKKRDDFATISVRLGRLTMEPAGKVALGKIPIPEGLSSRDSLAAVIASMLEKDVNSCWLDMLDGQEDLELALNKFVEEAVDCVEGEPFCH